MSSGGKDQLTRGVIARWSGIVYWFVVVEGLIVLTALPSFVLVLFLERDASNIPLYALALVPLGPALGAALFTWREFERDKDPYPARHFWRGYLVGWRDVLKTWIALVLALMVLSVNIAFRDVVGVPDVLTVGFGVLAAGLLLWACNAVPIAALLTFRLRDSARLAAYYLVARPAATLGWLVLGVLVVGILWYSSDWVLALALSPLTYLAYRTAAPMIAEVTANHTPPAP